MIRNTKLLSTVIGVAVVGLVLSIFWGCAKEVRKPFKIAIVTWVGYGPFYVAQEKGYFAQEGLDVEIIKIEDTGARHAALTGGDVEAAINTIDAFAIGAAEGLPGMVCLKIDDSCGGDGIVVRNEIKTTADLKGKAVAYPKGMPSHFFLLYLLDQAGLSSKDIISRHMEAGEAGAAFVAGKVDAAVTWEPWLTNADKTEHGYILTTSKESTGLIVDILMVSKKVAKERPTDVQKILRAWFKAVDYVRTHPDKSNKIMAEALGLPEEDFIGMVAGVKFADYEENLRYFGLKPGTTDEFSKVFNKAGEIWIREGVIKRVVDTKEVLATSFLLNLYK